MTEALQNAGLLKAVSKAYNCGVSSQPRYLGPISGLEVATELKFGSPPGAFVVQELQECHLLVNIVLIAGALLGRVFEVRGRASVDVGVQKLSLVDFQGPRLQVLVGLVDALHSA